VLAAVLDVAVECDDPIEKRSGFSDRCLGMNPANAFRERSVDKTTGERIQSPLKPEFGKHH